MIRRIAVFAVIVASCCAGGAMSFTQSASASQSFSFGAAGDYGANSNVTATLTNMASSNLNFALALGDLSYNQVQPAAAWCSYVKQNIGSLPFELISGNHEDGGEVSQGLIWDFASCLPNQMSTMSGKYSEQYYFDYPVSSPIARFIMISPGLIFGNGDSYNYNKGGAAYTWVSNTIDQARAQGIRWIIVGMHKVCLTSGVSSCEIGTDIENLLISKHVDLILEGHDHNYQRSSQISLGSGCSAVDPGSYNSSCVVNSGASGIYQAGQGTVIVISGTGGIDDEFGAIDNNPDSPYFPVRSGNNLNPQKGFVKYTVSKSAITAQFVPSTHTSNFTDSFSISATGSDIAGTNFDSQSTGPLITTGGKDSLNNQAGSANLAVQNQTADSAPNALAVTLTPNGRSYVAEQYSSPGYTAHTLEFNVQLGTDFNVPSSDYTVLARTGPAGSSMAGQVSVVLAGGVLHLDYFDSGGGQHSLWGSSGLSPGGWHTLDLQENVGTNGTIALYVDGVQVIGASGVDLSSQPIGYVQVGNVYTSNDPAVSGHVYVDDVVMASGGFPTPLPPSQPPTPTPTLSAMPSPTATPTSSGSPTATPTSAPTSTATPTATLPPSPTSTSTAQSGVTLSDNFDSQTTGALVYGGSGQFTQVVNPAGLAVENSVAASPPNALGVAVQPAHGLSDATVKYSTGYHTHTLALKLMLGSDFVLPNADYMVLAQTNSSSGNPGKVDLVLAGGTLRLDYFDSSGTQRFVWGNGQFTAGVWHSVVVNETTGKGSGSLSLSVDGTVTGAAANIDVGSGLITAASIGDLGASSDSAIAGHVYYDDVVASTNDAGGTPTPTPSPTAVSSVTPTPTPSPTPLSSATPTATPTIAPSPTPTTGSGNTLVSDNFDSQAPGPVVVGGANGVTGVSGGSAVTVENALARSVPNGLSVGVIGGGGNYVYYQPSGSGVTALTLRFAIQLGSDFVLPSSDYMVLAVTAPSASSNKGRVSLVLSGGSLHLDYIDNSGNQKYVFTGANITPGTWHTISISETIAGANSSLSLTFDGAGVGSASGVNLGSGGVIFSAVGDEYNPTDPAIAGHLFVDDLSATTP